MAKESLKLELTDWLLWWPSISPIQVSEGYAIAQAWGLTDDDKQVINIITHIDTHTYTHICSYMPSLWSCDCMLPSFLLKLLSMVTVTACVFNLFLPPYYCHDVSSSKVFRHLWPWAPGCYPRPMAARCVCPFVCLPSSISYLIFSLVRQCSRNHHCLYFLI